MNKQELINLIKTDEGLVNIFIDRVEISSPGGLMKALKKEDFGNKSMPRNQLLFDLMARTDYVEKAGTGIKRIKNAMKKYGLKVEFKSTGFFTSILHREKINEPAKNQPKTSQKPAKEERKKLILEAIKGRRFTKRTFADELRINKSTVESDLEELKKERIIEFVGSKKGGYWKILK